MSLNPNNSAHPWQLPCSFLQPLLKLDITDLSQLLGAACSKTKVTFNAMQPVRMSLPIKGLMYRWQCDLFGPYPESGDWNYVYINNYYNNIYFNIYITIIILYNDITMIEFLPAEFSFLDYEGVREDQDK